MIKDNQRLLNLFLLVVDGLLLVLSMVVAFHLRFSGNSLLVMIGLVEIPDGEFLSFSYYTRTLIFLVPCYIFSYYIFNMYNPNRLKTWQIELGGLVKSNVFGLACWTFILFFVIKEINYARRVLGIFFMLNIILDFAFRMFFSSMLKMIRRRGINLRHILLVGYSRAAEGYIDRIIAHPEWGYQIHGILDDHKKRGKSYNGVEIVGSVADLENKLDTNEYDEIAITLSINEFEKLEGIVALTEKSGVHTKFIPDYNNIIPTKPNTEDVDGLPVIHVRRLPLSNPLSRSIKRTLDVVGALVAIVLFSIPMLIVAILVKLTSPGPLIFKQKRIGLHNKDFYMYKFRSMKVQSEEAEKKAWTTINDPRITPLGKFIRSTSLDELPQFFNVLQGSMSLVGPRPERPYYVDQFKEKVPRYMIKHQVRPGITGWAQVNGYRGDTSIRKRIECDLYYIENWTLGLDVKILFLTVFKGFINKNAY